MTDPRPTQAEVEAMAAEIYGAEWKSLAEERIAWWNERIARKLDVARAAVLRTR